MNEDGTTWTLTGIGFVQVGIARGQLLEAQGMIRTGDTAAAVEQISATIRQLEAARRHLA